jgi:hypothetical protein
MIYCRHSRHKLLLDTFHNPLTVLYDSDIIYISLLQSVSFIFVAKFLLLHCYRIATKRKAKDRDDCRLYEGSTMKINGGKGVVALHILNIN